MKAPWFTALPTLALAVAGAAAGQPFSDDLPPKSVSTLLTTPLVIEGLTSDDRGNLYAPARNTLAGAPCPVYRTSIDHPSLSVVGFVPAPSTGAPCSTSGLAFGPDGRLYVTESTRIHVLTPSSESPPDALPFAENVPNANGVAFDREGNLWTGDGTAGLGRIWRISPSGGVVEQFRIQPMANDVAAVGNVGRDVRTLPQGRIGATRTAADQAGSQPLVANGLAFDRAGNLFIADSARGAIWRARFGPDGALASRTGCDSTFPPDTLCLDSIYVSHPLLEGVDGIALDVAGNIWAVSNERNAILFVEGPGSVLEVFRNPVSPLTLLRNEGPLESPASPVLIGNQLCTSNSDGNRRDNSPPGAGEIGGPGRDKGKISCMDQRVAIPGLPLPVH